MPLLRGHGPRGRSRDRGKAGTGLSPAVPADVRETAGGWDLEVLRATLLCAQVLFAGPPYGLGCPSNGELTTAQEGIVGQFC